jgi:Cysteine rich repeat
MTTNVPLIRGKSMKHRMRLPTKLGLLSILVIFPMCSASAQTDLAKSIQQKLAALVTKLENSCAGDIKKYCSQVTRGEGRMIYCMQAHEDKITAKCAYDLEEAVSIVQSSTDSLHDAVAACKAEITGVCGNTVPGQGRIAACLLANKSTASKDCIDAIKKVEAIAAQ